MRATFWIINDHGGIDYENRIGTYTVVKRDNPLAVHLPYLDRVQDSLDGTVSNVGYITITFCEAATSDAYMEGLILGFNSKECMNEMMNRLADCVMNHSQYLDGRGLDFKVMMME